WIMHAHDRIAGRRIGNRRVGNRRVGNRRVGAGRRHRRRRRRAARGEAEKRDGERDAHHMEGVSAYATLPSTTIGRACPLPSTAKPSLCAGHTEMTCAPAGIVASGTSDVVFDDELSLMTAPSVAPKNANCTKPVSVGAAPHVPDVLRTRGATTVVGPLPLAIAVTIACMLSLATWSV